MSTFIRRRICPVNHTITLAVSNVLILLALSVPVGAVPVSFDGNQMELTACANLVNSSTLRLAPGDSSTCVASNGAGGSNRNGSAYIVDPFALNDLTSFSAAFSFQLHGGNGPSGADGFTFTVTNDSRGNKTLWGGGGDRGASGIQNSFSVGFNTFQNWSEISNNSIDFLRNGVQRPDAYLLQANAPFDLNDGRVHFAWVDYSGTTDVLELFVNASNLKPGTPFMSYSIDLTSAVGSQFYAGFTAASGGLTNDHDIKSFSFETYGGNVPEPTTLALMALGVAGLGYSRRKG